MTDLVAEAYTNEFGQTIQPGDDVVYVGTGYGHSVRVNKGKFAGVYYGTGRHYVKDEKDQYVRDENGQVKFEMKQYVKAVRVDGVPRRSFRYNAKTRKGEYVDLMGCAVLPLKRVYKIDIPMKEFAGTHL